MKYTYEDEAGNQYEFSQSMKDDAYTQHPDTGVAIKRVITGGCGFSEYKLKEKTKLTMNDCRGSKFHPANIERTNAMAKGLTSGHRSRR